MNMMKFQHYSKFLISMELNQVLKKCINLQSVQLKNI